MTRKDLRDSGVAFIADPHGYVRRADGRQLQGVTAMIHELLFPDEYSGVSLDTLSAKSEYGKERHREIQEMIVFGDAPQTEAQHRFAALTDAASLTPVASEYTVTDFSDFASNIDVVCSDGSLIDIKTTASLNRAKVGWQLSLYALMFEAVNPGMKAGRLYAAWLPKRGEERLVEVPRRPEADLRALMAAWISGSAYTPPAPLRSELVEEIADIKRMMDGLGERYDALTAQIMEEMAAKGETTYSHGGVTLSVRQASKTLRFDSMRFKAEEPDTYARYLRETETKGSLSVRLKKD